MGSAMHLLRVVGWLSWLVSHPCPPHPTPPPFLQAADMQFIRAPPPPPSLQEAGVQFIRVETVTSPSWVAWSGIQVYGD